MPRPQLVVAENNNLPILIIDREGSVGLGLYSKLNDQLRIVLVGGREPQTTHNLLFLPLSEHIPVIPKDQYSHIFIITESEKDVTLILPSCIEKAKEDKARLLLIITSNNITDLQIAEILRLDNEVNIILVKDMFGIPYESKNPERIEKLFYQAKIKKAMNLSHMGLHKLYPVQYDDVLAELIKLAFGGKHAAQLFFLFCRFPVTELGLAHALQKVDPLIKLDFHDENEEIPQTSFQGGHYLLPEHYPVFTKLNAAFSQYMQGMRGKSSIAYDDTRIQVATTQKIKSTKDWKVKYVFLSVFIFFLVMVILPIIATFSYAIEGRQLLLSAKDELQKGHAANARKYTKGAGNSFVFAEQILHTEAIIGGVLGLQKYVNSYEGILETGLSLSQEINRIAYTGATIKNVITGNSSNPNDDLRNAVSSLKQSITQAQVLAKDDNVPLAIRLQLQAQLQSSGPFTNIAEGLPALLSVGGKKTYAVIFQNNMELRPGGGFIGSYGLLTLNKGKIVSFSIHDVYDADGQLRGHIEPPFVLRRYLPSAHWYLRDSNFSVDFLKNASQVAFFLQLETGQQIDGVVGVDLSFVKAILQSMGSVYVPTYSEIVTPNNFFTLIENHAERNFFPGSSQKKDFLQSLFVAIQGKITTNKVDFAQLISQAAIAAQEKHLLFAFADKPSQDLFTVNNLSSTLWDPRPQGDGRVNDFLGINEANLGINKVNYYIDRSVDQRVAINDTGDVSEQVTLTYMNKSKDETWPGGTYKNYLRFILPQNTALVKIMLDGQDQKMIPAIEDFKVYEAKNFVPPAGLEVSREDDQGKTIYGFLVNVPPNSKKVITVIYVLSQKFVVNKLVQHFTSLYFKQPGTDSYPYTFSLTYPSSLKAISAPASYLIQSSQIVSSENISVDQLSDMALTKK